MRLKASRCRESGEGDLRSFNLSRYAAGETMRAVGLERLPEEGCKYQWHD
jgi:hypothetical protein